jgi:hypothetical protein
MLTPAADISETKEKPNRHTERRLNELIRICEGNGILVCLGEQSAEYMLFRKTYPGQTNYL